jgi:acyl-CoA synthetase (AMP-forming)/AMP-acid ligase II
LALKLSWRDELRLPLVESYGQSELGGFVALGYPEPALDSRMGAVGRPLPDKEVRVLDAAGAELPTGDIGELCVRGGFMKGYWGKPDKTADALRGGWLHTGDAGTMDPDGYVTMRGRFSELFSVGGRTWFPRDVEEALCSIPGVQAAAVVGLPDSGLGHRPVAFVITEGGEFDAPALKQAIQSALTYDLKPLEILRVKEFPMTPTGKIAKAELRDQAIAGAIRPT